MHNHIQREAHIRMFKKEKNNCGFTLAELLIVVAIIAVLVAISIPIFTGQLEKAREAVDLDTVRSAYSTMKYAEMLGEGPNGEKLVQEHYYFYLKSDGTFQQIEMHESAGSDAYKMKSHGADITDWAGLYVTDLKDANLYLVIFKDDATTLYTMYCY